MLLVILCLINSVYHVSSSRVSKWIHSDSHAPIFVNYASSNGIERPRVLNGQPVSHRSFPFAVSILAVDENGALKYKCGGSIISRTAVLSAAHCVVVYPSNPGAKCLLAKRNYSIVAGSDYVLENSEFKQQSPSNAVYLHPSCFYFTYSVLGFDTSVVTLRTPLFYNHEVQPLKIFCIDEDRNLREFDRLAKARTECHVVGYGQSFQSRTMQFMLLGSLTLMTNDDCAKTKCSNDKSFCNANFRKNAWSCGSNAVIIPCRGDSGWPIVCDGLLFGTLSRGMGCFSGRDNPVFFADMQSVTYMVVNYGDRNYIHARSAADVHTYLPLSYYIMASLLAPIMMQSSMEFIHT